MIGDRETDVACANAAGVRPILVTASQRVQKSPATAEAGDLAEAARFILNVLRSTKTTALR